MAIEKMIGITRGRGANRRNDRAPVVVAEFIQQTITNRRKPERVSFLIVFKLVQEPENENTGMKAGASVLRIAAARPPLPGQPSKDRPAIPPKSISVERGVIRTARCVRRQYSPTPGGAEEEGASPRLHESQLCSSLSKDLEKSATTTGPIVAACRRLVAAVRLPNVNRLRVVPLQG